MTFNIYYSDIPFRFFEIIRILLNTVVESNSKDLNYEELEIKFIDVKTFKSG